MTGRTRVAFALLTAGAGTSVYLLLRGQPAEAPSLDLVFRRFHLSWETGAAILWPLAVVWWEERRSGGGRPWDRLGRREAVRGVVRGWAGLVGAIVLGAALGVGAASLGGGLPAVGDPAVPLAMALTLTSLYLLASALALGSRRPWWWLLGLYLVPNALAPILSRVWWAPVVAVRRWVAVGALGPGTALEVPALAGGLVLEPEWEGLNPWLPGLFWLAAAVVTLAATLAWRYGDRPAPAASP